MPRPNLIAVINHACTCSECPAVDAVRAAADSDICGRINPGDRDRSTGDRARKRDTTLIAEAELVRGGVTACRLSPYRRIPYGLVPDLAPDDPDGHGLHREWRARAVTGHGNRIDLFHVGGDGGSSCRGQDSIRNLSRGICRKL